MLRTTGSSLGARLAPAAQFARRHAGLAAILLFAFALRWLQTFPNFLYGDEAEYAIVARSLAQDPRMLVYPDLEHFGPTPFVSQPPLILYLFAIASNLTGNPEAAPLWVNIFLGTGTVALVYAIGCRLQGRVMGLSASCVMAAIPAHVLVSRKAFLDVGMTFFMTLAVLLFLVWAERRTASWALAFGAAAGAAALSKLPGFLIAAPLVLAAVVELVRTGAAGPDDTVRNARLRALRQLLYACGPPLVLAGAYLGLLWHLRGTIDLMQKLAWQWARVAQPGLVAPPDPKPWSYYLTDPSAGLVPQGGLVVVFLALLGAGLLLARPLRTPSGNVLILAWFASIFAFLALSDRKEWFYVAPLFVPFALLAGVPVRRLALLLSQSVSAVRGRRRGIPAPVAVASLSSLFLLAAGSTAPKKRAAAHKRRAVNAAAKPKRPNAPAKTVRGPRTAAPGRKPPATKSRPNKAARRPRPARSPTRAALVAAPETPPALLGAQPIAADVPSEPAPALGSRRPRRARARARAWALVVAILLLSVAQPTMNAVDTVVMRERNFGAGIKEAALLIQQRDPQAGQVGSLLGRFGLHYYNGQATYHWYVPHDHVNASIEDGRVRFVVLDGHLDLAHERAWMRDLVERYDGALVYTHRTPDGVVKVQVYELHPRAASEAAAEPK